MFRLFIWLIRILSVMALLGVLAVIFAYYFFSRSVPEYEGSFGTPGVNAPVEIVRNHANVPHIFGTSNRDVIFGLGYAHAQDRLWQMTMMRRTAQGRLSEMFGETTLPIDMLMRRLDLYALAKSSVAAQSVETREILDAYAAGVNARLAEINENALGRGAPEFFAFSNAIAPWQPADTLSILKLMGVQLTGHVQAEVLRARVSAVLEEKRLNDILPAAPEATVEMPRYSTLFPDAPIPRDWANIPPHPLSPVKPRGLSGASNAWAAMGTRSSTGKSILANDPHLGFTAPAIWYLARVELEGGGVIGGTIPGMPLILVGRSESLGWGLTTAYVDDQDVLIEKLNPEQPNQYLTPEGWKEFETRRSIIQVKDAAPVTLDLRWTENGPVLPARHYNLGSVTPDGHVAAVSWTLLSDRDTSFDAGWKLMGARTVGEATRAMSGYLAPAQNLTLADETQIAMKTIGALPRRARDSQTQGRMPAPGWLEQNRWDGTYADILSPLYLNPEGGILGNTNNKFIDRPFPNHVSFEWGDTERVKRWAQLMQSRAVHTRDSFIETQLDAVSITARTLLPLIGAELWFETGAAATGSKEQKRADALRLLSNWNGRMDEHLPEPLIYAAWMRALQKRLIQDEMGPLTEEFAHLGPVFLERVYRNIGGASIWCDVVQSQGRESCTEIARLALDDAIVWLDEKYGGEIEALRWGDAHEATHDHAVLGNVPVLKWLVNIRQSTSGGDNTLLRGRSIGTGPDPFLNVHGAGYRGVYDFEDPDSSVFIISTGQSGHPLSRHYDDLGVLWRRGEYIPMSLDPSLARAASVGTTWLRPRSE